MNVLHEDMGYNTPSSCGPYVLGSSLCVRSGPNVLENERERQSCRCVIERREVRIGGAPEHAGNIESCTIA